jgi:hypothetical protein
MTNKQKRLLGSALAVISLALPAIALVSSRTRKEEPSTNKSVAVIVPEGVANAASGGNAGWLPADSNDQKIEVEVITVSRNGFEPTGLVRPHGRFMLAITNRSGENDLLLQLDRIDGNRVHEMRMPKGRVRWNPLLNLPPGDYLLKEQNHSSWVCSIKLTPN